MIHVNARGILERETDAGLEIVLQVRDKPYEGSRTLELPGGRVDPYESLLEALAREVQEETGLEVTQIWGADERLTAVSEIGEVECLRPFAVYQTVQGPVDSLGVYFRCRVAGDLLAEGDDTLAPRWVPVAEVAAQMADDPAQFSWIDCAGLQFYLAAVAGA